MLPDGSVYRGELKNGLLDGQGRLEWPDGNIYEGEFLAGQIDGRGVFKYSTGEYYEGNFLAGARHGSGRLVTPDGETFVGEFSSDDFTGEGRHEIDQRLIYEGEFQRWHYHGHGRLIWENGDEYIGEFEADEFHGAGEVIYKQANGGKQRLEGYWRRGRYVSTSDDAPEDGSPSTETALDAESLLFLQRGLLDSALSSVKASQPGRIDTYILGFAGDGNQDVFMKEVKFANTQLQRRYGTKKRSLLLINNSASVSDTPLASATNLRYALKGLAAKMQREDILFLFLTSHGSEDHELSVALRQLPLRGLSARELAEMLRESEIKWRVVVVSACYSGGFIPELNNDATVIITAASATNVSFGCSDDADLTYFGRAFLSESLANGDPLTQVFERSRKQVAAMERQQDYTNSDPQIAHSPAIVEHLERQRQQREQTRH